MALRLLRGVWANLGSLGLAFALALAVWVSAVVAEDPNEERAYPNPVPVQVVGLDSRLVIVGGVPPEVNVRLSAPTSLWGRLASETGLAAAQLDLSGLSPGEYLLPIEVRVALTPVRVVEVAPSEVSVTLEVLVSEEKTIRAIISGTPALGFQAEELSLSASRATVSGPESLVALVERVTASLDVNGARDSISATVPLQAVDANGQVIAGVTITPESVIVSQTILQIGGYRDVAVKVETSGQVATGYRITNISVSPPTVTIFSANPELVAQLPGFVATLPLDLTSANDDIEARLPLDLPDGVVIVGDDQNVLVLVGVAAIETNVLISVPVEVVGLNPGLSADVSPDNVDVILFGPLPILDALAPGNVRIVVDLTGLSTGTHLVTPQGEVLPEGVEVVSITPATIAVVISFSGSPTRTPTPPPPTATPQ